VDPETLSDETLAQHFMPRIAVPDHERWLEGNLALSALVREQLVGHIDLRYGPGPRQVLDAFPSAAPGAPVFVWFHGGYWRALGKDSHTFLVPPLHDAGAAVVLVNYDLCPAVTLRTLIGETHAALRWIAGHAKEFGGDAGRLVVGGNSAGAHICAMALQHAAGAGHAALPVIRAAALVTGIYDLRPVPRLPVQADLHLTSDEIRDLSPLLIPLQNRARCLVAVGGDEPELWIDQSRQYHALLSAAGVSSELMIVPERHHFSITRDLADDAAPLTRAIIGLLEA
jgi:arylformamidase